MPRARGFLVIISVALGLLFISPAAFADVTGNFKTNISFTPESTESELSLLNFDVVNEFNGTVSISGLSTTLHSHFGIAGVEDVIITLDGVMGFLSFNAQVVFGRFASGPLEPFYDDLRLVAKILEVQMGLGGVTFTNIAMFRDVLAFIVDDDPFYAFGDALFISGQTISGISIQAGAGFCLEERDFNFKHHELTELDVNPECATEPKPDILFDFEEIFIENVPLAPGVVSDTSISCVRINACRVISEISFSGGPVPFSTAIYLEDLLTLEFGFAEFVLNSGPASLSFFFGEHGTIGMITLDLSTTINPESHPATLTMEAVVVPGVGLTEAIMSLTVQRAGLVFSATTEFDGGATTNLSEIVFELATTLGLLGNLSMEAAFQPTGGLTRAEIVLTLNF